MRIQFAVCRSLRMSRIRTFICKVEEGAVKRVSRYLVSSALVLIFRSLY
jgi:hypothetical protein